jgi:hypothetical protein
MMMDSEAYSTLPANAKILMQLMQCHWSPDKNDVGFGIQQAMDGIGCSKRPVQKTFKILQERGFIVCLKEHVWVSYSGGSKVRLWRLTWLRYQDENPTNEWLKWKPGDDFMSTPKSDLTKKPLIVDVKNIRVRKGPCEPFSGSEKDPENRRVCISGSFSDPVEPRINDLRILPGS